MVRAGEHNCTVIVLCRYLLCCCGLYVVFVGGGLRDTDEINCYIALRSAGERVFCGYMKSAVLSQLCAVTAFGEWLYFTVLHGGQSVTVSLISHLTQ